jgi:hypothetical protein
VFDLNFRTITDVLDSMQSLSLYSNETVSVGSSSVLKVLQFNNPQTPWLNNPTTWSVDM